jgi:hypothetical protein
MITIDVVFSIDLEVQRVRNAIRNFPWYAQHGYAEKLLLPRGISATATDSEIIDSVRTEYDVNRYDAFGTTLKNVWDEFCESNAGALRQAPIQFERSYSTVLTKYGTGGSYRLPNTITVNITKNSPGISVLLHEMTHIAVEPLIQRHGLAHSDKEAFVRMLCDQIFASFTPAFRGRGSIEQAFFNLYPDLAAIVTRIAETRRARHR